MQDAHNFEMKGILIGTIGLIYLLTFFILRASTKLVSVLGAVSYTHLDVYKRQSLYQLSDVISLSGRMSPT